MATLPRVKFDPTATYQSAVLPRVYFSENGPATYVPAAPTGGMLFSGTSLSRTNPQHEGMTGGVLFGGTAGVVKKQVYVITSGGMLFGGAATYNVRSIHIYPTGGLAFSGAALSRAPVNRVVTNGGLLFGGTASAVKTQATEYIFAELLTITSDITLDRLPLVNAALPTIGFSGTLLSYPQGFLDNCTLPTLGSEVLADCGQVASISAELSVMNSSISVSGKDIDAELTTIQAVIAAENYGLQRVVGDMPVVQATFNALLGSSATIEAKLPTIAARAGIGATPSASIDTSMPIVVGDILAHSGSGALVSAALPLLGAEVTALNTISAGIDAKLTSVSVTLFGEVVNLSPQQVFALNLTTLALSTYNMPKVDSIVADGYDYYAATSAGYAKLVETSDDTGAVVIATVKTGKLRLNTTAIKRVSAVYVNGDLDDAASVAVWVDDNFMGEYSLSTFSDNLYQRRALLGKGARGVNWQFEIKSGGGQFSITDLQFDVAQTARRV